LNVIAISGHARSGKDTTASIMVRRLEHAGKRVLVTHYADLLKYICKTFLGWNGLKDERGRHILQYVGTDVVRKKDEDFWVRFVLTMIDFFGENWDVVVIPDVRFPNEVNLLSEAGHNVTHIRVVRDENSSLTDEQKQHSSEVALDQVEPDYYVVNNGTIADLDVAVSGLLEEINYGGKQR